MKSCLYKILPTKYSFTNLWLNVYTVTNRLSLGLRKQARNENNKKDIYKIARMSQGSIKNKGELWEGNFSSRRLSVNHSRISDKHSQNQHNTI